MLLRTARGTRFRHVVFAGAGAIPQGRAAHFSPAPATRGVGSAAADAGQLSVEEESFIGQLFEQAGLDARIYRRETLRRRLPACLRAIRACSPIDGRRILQKNPCLVGRAISALVIGVTSFFRDPDVFDAIRRDVFPSICAGKGRPRVWSVGCSEGAELYSIAILLSEARHQDGASLLGTDCRLDALARARAGIFDAAALRAAPQRWIQRYFEPVPGEAGRFEICPSLRAAAHWRTADVTRVQEPGQWDLILCRNMAMYLRTESSGKLWCQFEQLLRPGGFLVLGKAERPTGAARLSMVGPCLYRRDRG